MMATIPMENQLYRNVIIIKRLLFISILHLLSETEDSLKSKMMSVMDVNHKRIQTNGIWMHVAEKGTVKGPLVLLLHGFPETWFSWRHQINFLAEHGYHVIAPDLRGYGDTDSPLEPSSYTVFHIVGDLIDLLDHFGQKQTFVVGINWGAIAAWHLGLFRPDRVRGIISLSVPFYPRFANVRSLDSFRQMFGEEFYICQFQKPGRAEQAFARYDYLTVMKKFHLITRTDLLIAPPGMEIIDFLETPSHLPEWITEEELQVTADKFQESGFTGAFNYFRAMDLNWELLEPWQRSKMTVPTKLILGNKDIGCDSEGTREFLEGEEFKKLVPDLEFIMLDGHHHLQQEKAQEVSREILTFLQKFSA